MTAAPPDSETVEWTWARVRMLTERGSLAEAIEEDRRPVSPEATALGRQLRALSTAGLLAALGRTSEAIRGLENAMSEAEEEGCSLLLPEVTAKMVILTAPSDPDAAIALFELFDWAAGSEIGHPREGYLRLLARAAVRGGRQELDRAAAAAANAARIARESGLVLLASEAYLAQAPVPVRGRLVSGCPCRHRQRCSVPTGRWHGRVTRRPRQRRGEPAPVTDRSTSRSRSIPSDFDTWAIAPRAIAASTVVTSSAALRITTRAAGCCASTCSRATNPPPPGMYRSRIRTSGASRSFSCHGRTRLVHLCDHDHVRLTRQALHQAPAQDLVVIGHQDPDHGGLPHLMGKRATTLAPPSGGVPTAKLPPTSPRVSSSSRRPK